MCCVAAMRYVPVSLAIEALTIEACQQINFATIPLDSDQLVALDGLNRQLIPFCKSLPPALQPGAIFAIQQHFTGFQLGNLQRFFTKFYAPSWTLLGWMGQCSDASPTGLTATELQQAINLQGMAYFLHMLDDHLADGQIPISHLLLQLRTQAWMRFTQGAEALLPSSSAQDKLIYCWINRYFSGIQGADSVENLADYCEQFRQQLSTTLVLPMIVADRTGHNSTKVQASYEAFCIAWRLLDDLRDCQDDARAGELSGIYYLLPPDLRQQWQDCQGVERDSEAWLQMAAALEQSGVLQQLVAEIVDWLALAQTTARQANLPGYAQELQQLAIPLVKVLG
jgi:hypothetical protein